MSTAPDATEEEKETLRRRCERQVQELHTLFVTWFQGKQPRAELEAELRERLAPEFSHVAPNGQFIRGRDVLVGHLQDKYDCYRDRVFQIDVYNVRLLWTDDSKCLCTYEEWQSWKQEEEDIQFGRLSTCLLHRVDEAPTGKMQWIHVHETWLEADAPPPKPEAMPDVTATAAAVPMPLSVPAEMEAPESEPEAQAETEPETLAETEPEAPVEREHETLAKTIPEAPAETEPQVLAETEPEAPAEAEPEAPAEMASEAPPVAVAEAPSESTPAKSAYQLIFFVNSVASDYQQLIHQKMANRRLEAMDLEYETVDGGDPQQRNAAARLSDISKTQDVFPLFFLKSTEDISYWGDWEQFLNACNGGTLSALVNSGTPAPPLAIAAVDANEVVDDKETDSEENTPVPAVTAGVVAATAATGAVVAMATNEENVSKLPVDKEVEPTESPKQAARTSATKEEQALKPVAKTEEQAPKVIASKEEQTSKERAYKPPAALAASKKPAPASPAPAQPVTFEPSESAVLSQSYVNKIGNPNGSFAREVSNKRHVSPLLQEFARPLMWESSLVGVAVAGFNIGTSQGPMGDEAWYKQNGAKLEEMAQSRSIPRPRRKICLPEMVFPTAHVAIEGHSVWFSWDCSDALEAWARAHHEIAIHSRISHNGVSVMRARDANLWDTKRKHGAPDDKVSAVFHYDWTFSTPFAGKHEGGKWKEMEQSGMRVALLTDTSVPILFFDEIILFEDDLHDNGQTQYSVKLRVMPTCSYVLARLWVRVDNVILRVRETRILFVFGDGSSQPEIFRDITWRECMWPTLAEHKLPTDVKAWTHTGPETPAWSSLLKSLPEVSLPRGMPKHAVYEYTDPNN